MIFSVKKILSASFCLLLLSFAQAQTKMDFIDADQIRIDKLDGKEDKKVETGDAIKNEVAQKVYFKLIDTIQQEIGKSVSPEDKKKNYRDYIFRTMRMVYEKNYQQPERFEKIFSQQLSILKAINGNSLAKLLQTNDWVYLQSVGLFKYESCADSFLSAVAAQYPEQVIENFSQFSDQSYAVQVLDIAAKAAPLLAKKYILEGNPIHSAFKKSTDSVVALLLKLNHDYGKKTNAFVLIDEIAKGKISIAKADSIGREPLQYLRHLMNIRIQKHPLGEQSVEQELEISALKYVRKINDLHNENDDAIRFKGVNNFSAQELYTLIVYSEEDIFTSTFNGIFKRFITKLGKQNGAEFLKTIGENHFRVFIKQCASYGKLKGFLATMSLPQRENLMVQFAADLEENNIAQAVEVADAYTSIGDSVSQKILQSTIQSEFERVSKIDNKKGMAIYGLLSNLFTSGALFKSNWYQEISAKYKLPPLDKMPNARLFENNKTCVWHMYFYDDEDGGASYQSFIQAFTDKNWKIESNNPLYVKIEAVKGKPVVIFANKPKSEYEGQAALEQLFDSAQIVPDVLIHRGHSYYAHKTITKTKPTTKIFVLGSCGGYHSLFSIIDKAPEVNIISSKQIGVQGVNNPLLKILADTIREGKDVEWQTIWNSLDTKLKGTESYNRFLDYIPPHKNLGAIFIRAYNNLTQE